MSEIENEIKQLVGNITENNEAYRTGNTVVSDELYDAWVDRLEEIDPDNPILAKVGFTPKNSSRKQKLPIPMKSMNKIKTIEDLYAWLKSKNIPSNTEFTLSPKYDGCAFVSNENTTDSFTRGDGEIGQYSPEHYNKIKADKIREDIYTVGEVIMPRQIFMDKYSEEFENPRNFVSGLLNSDDAREALSDCYYIKYGVSSYTKSIHFNEKTEILDYLNEKQPIKVPYRLVTLHDLSKEYFTELFMEWNKEFEIDGIIIEINNLKLADSIGRETNGNPGGSRAFKGEFEERKETTVEEIEWNISKKGFLIPRIRVKPIRLDNVTVTYVTGNNAKYIIDMGLGTGSRILMKRSGFVIPFIIKTIDRVEFEMPNVGHELKWDANNVHLRTVNKTDEQRLQQLISFFNIMDVDAVKEGVITQLFESGYDTVKKILSMSKEDLLSLDRFGERKAEQVYSNIHSKMKDVTLSKLQHASSKFNMLGSKKLLLLEELENPTFNDICDIEGFSDISAQNYFDGIYEFNEFLEDLGDLVVVKKTEKVEATGSDLEGMSFVFSGYRDKEAEEIIKSLGGEIKSGISTKVTHLVVKDKQSGSSKIVKAEKLGINILDVEELMEMLAL